VTTRYVLSAAIGDSPLALVAGSSTGFTLTDFDVAITGTGSGTLSIGRASDVVSGETGTEWNFYPFDAADDAAQASAVVNPSEYSGVSGVNLSWGLMGPSAGPVGLIRYPVVVAPAASLILLYTGPDSLIFNLFIEE
jgi:hypothetical protein